MIICAKCGSTQDETRNRFCSNCGQPLMIPKSQAGQQRPPQPQRQIPVQPQQQRQYQQQGQYQQNQYQQRQYQQNPYQNYSGMTNNEILTAFIKMLRTDAIIWLCVGIAQIVLGLVELCFFYGISVIAIGIWNIYNSTIVKKNANFWETSPTGIYAHYEPRMTMDILFLCLNLFLGSIIGVIGSIYDIMVRNYVMSHRDEFLSMEGRSRY